jgi:hypothetical protein
LIFDDSVAIKRNGFPGLDLCRVGSGRVEYERRTGMDPGFCWCIYNAVIFGFWSSAGPIARPVKRLAREEIRVPLY